MQNYLVDQPVTGGGEMATAVNSAGAVELFSIGSGGNVYNTYPDTTSASGWTTVAMGLTASSIAAGRLPDGRLVLLGGEATFLNYFVETPGGPSKWGPMQSWQHGDVECRPFVYCSNQQFLVGLLSFSGTGEGPTGTSFRVSAADWSNGPVALSGPVTAVQTSQTVAACAMWYPWQTPQEIFLYTSDGQVTPCTFSQGVVTPTPPISNQQFAYTDINPTGWSAATLPMPWVQSIAGARFCWIGTGGVLSWTNGWGATVVGYREINGAPVNLVVTRFVGGMWNGEMSQVVLMDNHGVVYVTSSTTDSVWPSVVPLGMQASQIAYALDGDGNAQFFSIGPQNQVNLSIWRGLTDDWDTEPVEVQGVVDPTTVPAQAVISYTTEMTVLDSTGNPAPNVPVSIVSSDLILAFVNGVATYIDSVRPALTNSNSTGLVTVWTQTDSLSTTVLQVSTDLMPAGTAKTIEPNADVHAELSTLTGTDLINDGVLPQQFQSQADQIATIVTEAMALTEDLPGNSPAMAVFGAVAGPPTAKRLPPGSGRHWSASIRNGTVTWQSLSAEEAAARIQAHALTTAAEGPSAGLVGMLWDGLWSAVRAGVGVLTNALEIIVSATAQGITVAITAVIDTVTYVWNGLVTLVEQAFDIVEGVFETIGVAFQTLFEWLGFLFDWQAILRTQAVIEYTISESFNMLSGMISWLQSLVDSQIGTWEGQIQSWASAFNQSPNSAGTYLSLQEMSPAAPENLLFATSHNLALNGLVDNYTQVSVTASALGLSPAADPTNPISVFITTLVTNFNNIDVGPAQQALQAAIDGIQSILTQSGGATALYQTAMSVFSNIVVAIAQIGLEVAQFIVDTISAALNALIQAFNEMLSTEWKIPFVSSLYRMATATTSNPTGSPLTAGGLVSLVAAIPATVLFKIIHNNAPFETDADVAAFKAQYTSQTLLSGMGISNGTAAVSPAATVSNDVQMLMAIIGLASNGIIGVTSAVLDLQPIGAPTQSFALPFSIWNVIGEAMGAFACAPFWSEFTGYAVWAWALGLTSCGLDAAYVWFRDSLPESFDNTGNNITCTLATVQFFLQGWGWMFADPKPDAMDGLASLISPIPGMLKPIRQRRSPQASAGLMIADLVCGPAASFLNIVSIIVDSTSGTAQEVATA